VKCRVVACSAAKGHPTFSLFGEGLNPPPPPPAWLHIPALSVAQFTGQEALFSWPLSSIVFPCPTYGLIGGAFCRLQPCVCSMFCCRRPHQRLAQRPPFPPHPPSPAAFPRRLPLRVSTSRTLLMRLWPAVERSPPLLAGWPPPHATPLYCPCSAQQFFSHYAADPFCHTAMDAPFYLVTAKEKEPRSLVRTRRVQA
jgi:hypothetical protein